jgi:hypothetical protein
MLDNIGSKSQKFASSAIKQLISGLTPSTIDVAGLGTGGGDTLYKRLILFVWILGSLNCGG